MRERDTDGGAVPVTGLDSVGGFRALVELSPDAVFVIRDGYHVFANARGLAMLGARTLADLQVKPANDFMHPDCLTEARRRLHTMVDDHEVLHYVEEKIVRLDGVVLDIEAAGTPIEVDGGTAALVVVRDITARKRAEAALRVAEGRFQAAFRYAPTAIAILDSDGRVSATNPTFDRLLAAPAGAAGPADPIPSEPAAGERQSRFAGRPFWQLAAPQDRASVRAALDTLVAGSVSGVRGDFRVRRPDGSTGWMHGRAGRLPGEPTYIVHLVDVTTRMQEQQVLAERAVQDPLTGLVNRAGLLEALEAALEEPHGDVAVLFADLDGFKLVNDSYGHTVGDQVLVAVARRMRAAVPSCDPVGRIGGDEFAIVLTGGEATGRARQIAERLHVAVNRPIAVASTLVQVGVSIGIATARAGQPVLADSLLAAADSAMYRAKALGRSRPEARRPEPGDDVPVAVPALAAPPATSGPSAS